MTTVSSAYAQRLVMTLFLVSFGIYLFLATVTYTPFDPGWMHISSDTQTVSNASGVAGAWISDLLFGFLGWASLLIPLYLFVEAVQVWWPHSFLNRPFRYAAQFFLLLTTSALLFLFWEVPADTLDNSSGGIIGYELGQSLEQLLTIYGAAVFLVGLWVMLFTLAFGVKWNKTWSSLKATPAYLQDLFYRNVPEGEGEFDRSMAVAKKDIASSPAKKSISTPVVPVPEHEPVEIDPVVRDHVAERLFDDIADREFKAQ
ncbi:DNA translocase FtsK 4TM domain-containing protein, partial [Acinetobacter schindleri]